MFLVVAWGIGGMCTRAGTGPGGLLRRLRLPLQSLEGGPADVGDLQESFPRARTCPSRLPEQFGGKCKFSKILIFEEFHEFSYFSMFFRFVMTGSIRPAPAGLMLHTSAPLAIP